MSNEENTLAGAADLTEKQIAAGAIVRCDHGGSIGRNAAIEVFDAMRAAAPVAAQAGQVAPADLHDAIMNIPHKRADSEFMNAEHRMLYKEGHRDARHDAAELAVGAAAGQVAVPERLLKLARFDFVDIDGDTEQFIQVNAGGYFLAHQVEALLAAAPSAPAVVQQAPAQAAPGWISVDERLPDGQTCLATYRNAAGKLRIIRAKYARQFEVDAGDEAIDNGNCEYNEADDTYYLKAGWLECIDNWDDYSSIYVTEGEVTHWMPLPALPAAQASTPNVRQEQQL